MEDDVSSKLHHYIPQFYLKGFTDEENMFFVYDKLTERIYRSSTKNSFAETHRNTGFLLNQETGETCRSDIAEQMLAHFDCRAATILQKVRHSSPDDYVINDINTLYEIRLLVNSIFWRSPVNDKVRNELIENIPFADLGFRIIDSAGIRLPDVEDQLKTMDLWKKTYPALLMISAVISKYKKNNDQDWKLYYLTGLGHITTDSPIILKEYLDLSSLQEELIFPLAGNILVVATKKYRPHLLPLVFTMKVNLMLFHLAGRYAASSNKKYLEFLATENRNNLQKPGWGEKLKEDIFNYFY